MSIADVAFDPLVVAAELKLQPDRFAARAPHRANLPSDRWRRDRVAPWSSPCTSRPSTP
jgi:hypothetical protein